LIEAIGVELTDALNRFSPRLAIEKLLEGIARVDRREGASDSDDAADVEDADCEDVKLGKITPLVSRLSTIWSSLAITSLCK
jgi:hypothetical protein